MKKLWKSTAALLMGLALAFSAACGTGGNSLSDSDAAGSSDTTTGSSDTGTSDTTSEAPDPASIAAEYAQKLVSQFADAKSVKLDVSFSVDNEETVVWDNDTTDVSVEKNEITAQLVLTYADGDFAMLMAGTSTSYEKETHSASEKDNHEDSDSVDFSVYILEGVVYVNNGGEYFTAMPVESVFASDETGIFSAIMESAGAFMKDGIDEDTQTAVAEMITEILSATDLPDAEGKISYETDMKLTLNMLIGMINAIDEETATVGELVDTVLALIDPELNTDTVLAMISSLDDVTFGEALEAIDGFLAAYDTSLQGIKDAVVAEPIVKDIVSAVIGASGEEFDALWTTISEMNLDDFFASFKSYKLNEIVGLFMDAEGNFVGLENFMYIIENKDNPEAVPPEYFEITFVQISDMIKAYMEKTLSEAGITLPELDNVTVTVASVEAEAVFGEDKSLISAGGSLAFGYSETSERTRTVYDSETPTTITGNGSETTSVALSLNLSEIGVETAIALPADAIVYVGFDMMDWTPADGDTVLNDGTYVYFNMYTDDSDGSMITNGYINILTPDNVWGNLYIEYAPIVFDAQTGFPTSLTMTFTGGYKSGIGSISEEELKAIFGEELKATVALDWTTGKLDVSSVIDAYAAAAQPQPTA